MTGYYQQNILKICFTSITFELLWDALKFIVLFVALLLELDLYIIVLIKQ